MIERAANRAAKAITASQDSSLESKVPVLAAPPIQHTPEDGEGESPSGYFAPMTPQPLIACYTS